MGMIYIHSQRLSTNPKLWEDLSSYLYEETLVSALSKTRILLRRPCNYSQRFSVPELGLFQYGAIFDPHTDIPLSDGGKWIHKFNLWHKDFVFVHTADSGLKVETPTLQPISFDYTLPHAFIHKETIEKFALELPYPDAKEEKHLIQNRKKSKIYERYWELQTKKFSGNLLFIGCFIKTPIQESLL